MQKRKVFTLGTVPRPMGRPLLTGGSAARFAGSILARHAVCDQDGSYPDAWLVLREEERQEQLQGTSEVHLTQLTLRLLLQLSAYFTETQPPRMELQSLQRSLTHCMTALENRESYGDLRLLMERLHTVKSATEIRQLQESIAHRLERVTLRETALSAPPRLAAASQTGAGIGRTGNSSPDQQRREERPTNRQHREEHPTDQQQREHPADLPHREERPADHRHFADTQAEGAAPPRSMGFVQNPPGHRVEPSLHFFAKEQTASFLSSIQTPFPFSVGIAPMFLASRSPLHENADSPAKSFSPQTAAEQRRFGMLTEHKEQLLRLLLNTDTAERETIWTLISTQTRLIDRHRDFLREETHLATEERLSHVIRQSTAQEYTKLLFVIQQAVQGKILPPETALPTEVPPSPTVPLSPQAKQAALCAAPLSALEQTRGSIRKTTLFQVLKKSPAPVRKAFFALADESGIWGEPPAREGIRARQQRLTQLLQRSPAAQLETLTQWLGQRVPTVEMAERELSTGKNAAKQTTVPKPVGNAETRVHAPATPVPDAGAEETAALTALQHFLTESRQEERQGLLQLTAAAPEEERSALLAGLAQLLPPQRAEMQGEGSPKEPLVYLLETQGDLPALAEQLRTTPPILMREQIRREEQHILTRLTAYGESRGNSWATQKEQLLHGLQERERQILLTRLESISPPPVKDLAVPLTAAQEFDRILEFRTQREYKSFRYQITRYLREQTPPPPPLAESWVQWIQEHRQAERQGAAQAVAALTAQRPAAWRQVFAQEGLAISPAVGEERALRESLIQAVETGAPPLYERLVQELTHRTELPPGLVAQALPALRQSLPPSVQAPERIPLALPLLQEPAQTGGTHQTTAQTMEIRHTTAQSVRQTLIQRLSPTGEPVRAILGASAKQIAPAAGNRHPGNPDRQSPLTAPLPGIHLETLLYGATNGAAPAVLAQTLLHELTQTGGRNPATGQTIEIRHATAESVGQTLIQRLFPTGETVRAILGASAKQTAPAAGNRHPGNPDRQSSLTAPLPGIHLETLLYGATNGAAPAVLAQTLLHELTQTGGRNPATGQTMEIRYTTAQSMGQTLIQRLFPTGETVRAITAASATQTAPAVERWRWGNTAALPRTSRVPAQTVAPPLFKNNAPLWRAARPDRREPDTTHRLVPPPARGNPPRPSVAAEDAPLSRPHYPEEETEMALRQTRTGEGLRHVADRVASRTAELTIQRQTPELHLLRTQTKEQAQTLEQQRKSLTDIQSQLERQEKLVQQALHKTDTRPTEVRQLTKAVLREMEGQLQLERQRRGM